MASLDQGVIESVINANFKAIAEQDLLSSQDHRNRMRILAETATANALNSMNTAQTDPTEAMGTQAVMQSGLSSQISALLAALSSAQQSVKVAGNTPPVTP